MAKGVSGIKEEIVFIIKEATTRLQSSFNDFKEELASLKTALVVEMEKIRQRFSS